MKLFSRFGFLINENRRGKRNKKPAFLKRTKIYRMEKLEGRHMLSGDSIDFDVDFILAGQTQSQQSVSASYLGPWELHGQFPNIDGVGDQDDWKSVNGKQFGYLESHTFDNAPTTNVLNATIKVKDNTGVASDMWISWQNISAQMTNNAGEFSIEVNDVNFPGFSTATATNPGVSQFTIAPYDSQAFGYRNLSVFTTPEDGYWSADSGYPINSEVLKVSNLSQPGQLNVPTSKWVMHEVDNGGTPNYYALFVGGLYEHTGTVDVVEEEGTGSGKWVASPKAVTTTTPLVIEVSGNFMPPVATRGAPNQVNLSSAYSVWDVGGSQLTDRAAMLDYIAQLNSGSAYVLNADGKGMFVQDSSRQFIVTGATLDARINGFSIIENYNLYPYGDSNAADPSSYDEAIYQLGAELIRFSTNFSGTSSNPAVDISATTVCWTPRLQRGSVQINDIGSPMVSFEDLVTYNSSADGYWAVPANQVERFDNSPAKFYDYRQLGSYIGQSDGPEIMSPSTSADLLYLHVNDDSVKLRASDSTFSNVTVLQGNAGFAASYAYGYINESVDNTTVTGLYAHRIVESKGSAGDPNAGLVWMGVVPSADYWFTDSQTGTFDLANTRVDNVYVPNLDNGTGNMNSVSRGMALNVAAQLRGYGPTPTISNYEFYVGNFFPSPNNPETVYGNWRLGRLGGAQFTQPYLGSSIFALNGQEILPKTVNNNVASYDFDDTTFTWDEGKSATIKATGTPGGPTGIDLWWQTGTTRPAVDLDGNGVNDRIWREKPQVPGDDDHFVAWLFNEDGSQKTGQRYLGGAGGWSLLDVGYFNDDNITDYLWSEDTTGATFVWIMNSDGTQQSMNYVGGINQPGQTVWSVVMTGDYDGNGTQDLTWVEASENGSYLNYVSMMLDNGVRTSNTRSIAAGSWELVQTAADYDANGDGKTDILWQDTKDGVLQVHFMNGAETAHEQKINTPIIGQALSVVLATGDFNFDGISDLIVNQNPNSSGGSMQLFNWGTETGTNTKTYQRNGSPVEIASTDFTVVQSSSYWGNDLIVQDTSTSVPGNFYLRSMNGSNQLVEESLSGGGNWELLTRGWWIG